MKYRIVETIEGFHPQEKQCFLFKWEYIDNLAPRHNWGNYVTIAATYDESLKQQKNEDSNARNA